MSLLVERIGEDGAAGVVDAVAENLYTGTPARWRRLDPVVSGQTLTVTGVTFTATYDMGDDGQLKPILKGKRTARATMSRTDLASLIKPDAVVAWSRGISELLQTDLREDGSPVRLATVIFKPPGPGPFPLAQPAEVRHRNRSSKPGSRSKLPIFSTSEDGSLLFRSVGVAENPMGSMTRVHDEGLRRIPRLSYVCDTDMALSGADRALTDIDAAIAVLRRRLLPVLF